MCSKHHLLHPVLMCSVVCIIAHLWWHIYSFQVSEIALKLQSYQVRNGNNGNFELLLYLCSYEFQILNTEFEIRVYLVSPYLPLSVNNLSIWPRVIWSHPPSPHTAHCESCRAPNLTDLSSRLTQDSLTVSCEALWLYLYLSQSSLVALSPDRVNWQDS